MVACLDEGANGGRCGVENGHTVFFDHFPETAEVGSVRCAFVHDLCHAVGQRAVDDVGVTGDPADIRRAPIDILITHVENVLAGGIGTREIATGGVENAFGFSRRTGGIEHE